jgi:hypothetical protein
VREDDPEDRRHRPGEVKEVEEKGMKEGETAEKRRESEREKGRKSSFVFCVFLFAVFNQYFLFFSLPLPLSICLEFSF